MARACGDARARRFHDPDVRERRPERMQLHVSAVPCSRAEHAIAVITTHCRLGAPAFPR
eukprot:SAG11_NODE_7577_length_1126_cov_1.454722_2_plen_59_part_00